MDYEGIVFDIKQLSFFDGPGIRTTVFLKGCPLRCQWCHNPEGISFKPQLMVSANGCIACGACQAICTAGGDCNACGKCTEVCPMGLRRISGKRYTATQLVEILLRDADYLRANAGGYTFSGGEPLAQPKFLYQTLLLLRGNHRAVETSGYCPEDVFACVISQTELIILDLKLANAQQHEKYTHASNAPILRNLELLKRSGKQFIIRIPVIPNVNDDIENYENTARLLSGAENLICVELLPYHVTAGAKYAMIGQEYAPDFDTHAQPAMRIQPFTRRGINCKIL